MRMQASLRTPLSFTVKDAIATAECLQRAVRDVHLVEKEPMPNFAEKTINSWAEFHAYTIEQNARIIIAVGFIAARPKGSGRSINTPTRSLLDWKIELKHAMAIEFQTIREFWRRLRDPQYSLVRTDTLSCLALMRHYGAPTRLFGLYLLSLRRRRICDGKRRKRPEGTAGRLVLSREVAGGRKQERRRPIKSCSILGTPIPKGTTRHFFRCIGCYQMGADAKSETAR